MILLDTSFLIELLSKRAAAVIKAQEIDAQPKAISSLTLYELFIGAQQLKRVGVIEEICETIQIIAPEKNIVKRAAFLQLNLRQKGNEIPAFDALIAATALEINAVVLSRDEHFKRVDGLRVAGW
ncbi:MAG: type II toxin-antitoxin system VapC family toxin [Theionarchaea archaeon]|nr:type II toxin-antitoxin system VapC family toxin [Theionarchaea archaeon]